VASDKEQEVEPNYVHGGDRGTWLFYITSVCSGKVQAK